MAAQSLALDFGLSFFKDLLLFLVPIAFFVI